MRRTLLLMVVASLIAGPALAQEPKGPPQLRCATTLAAAGRIQGTVVEDSTGRPVPHRGVFLIGAACYAATDSTGHFAFQGVPPGAYQVGIAPLGYRRHEPVPVSVQPRSTVDIDVRLLPENLIADCMAVSRCAEYLQTPSEAAALPPADRLREAALRTAIVLAGGWVADREWVPCVVDVPETVGVVLRQRFGEIAPASECTLPEDSVRRKSALQHTPTGRPARRISASVTKQVGSSATVSASYYVGPLHAEGWGCHFEKEGQEWVPRWCKMRWIS